MHVLPTYLPRLGPILQNIFFEIYGLHMTGIGFTGFAWFVPQQIGTSGQSYKHFTLVNYDSRVIPDWKIPHITILES